MVIFFFQLKIKIPTFDKQGKTKRNVLTAKRVDIVVKKGSRARLKVAQASIKR
jgi:hypothetical protein